MLTFSLWNTISWVVVVFIWMPRAPSAVTKPISFRRKVVDNGVFAGLMIMFLIQIEPGTWTSYLTWEAVVLCTAVISALAVWSVMVHIAGRMFRAVIGTGLGVLAGVTLVVVGIQFAHFFSPGLARDPILTLVAIGSLVGALTAAMLLNDPRPYVSAI